MSGKEFRQSTQKSTTSSCCTHHRYKRFQECPPESSPSSLPHHSFVLASGPIQYQILPCEIIETCHVNAPNTVLQSVEERWSHCCDTAVACLTQTQQTSTIPLTSAAGLLPWLYYDAFCVGSAAHCTVAVWNASVPMGQSRATEIRANIPTRTTSTCGRQREKGERLLSPLTSVKPSLPPEMAFSRYVGFANHAVGALWAMLLRLQHRVFFVPPAPHAHHPRKEQQAIIHTSVVGVAVQSRYKLHEAFQCQLGVTTPPLFLQRNERGAPDGGGEAEIPVHCSSTTTTTSSSSRAITATTTTTTLRTATKMVKSIDPLLWRLRFIKSPTDAARFL